MYAELIRTKFCPFCNENKSTTMFYKRMRSVDKLANKCKACDAKHSKLYQILNKDKIREQRKKFRSDNKERLSIAKNRAKCPPEQFKSLFEEQKGCCAICGTHQDKMSRRIAIDHNHATKAIRGLLCDNCNRCLGLLKDSKQILIKAIEYLTKYEK